MWDNSQLNFALGARSLSPSVGTEAKSVAASTDAGDSVATSEQDRQLTPVSIKQEGREEIGEDVEDELKNGLHKPVGKEGVEVKENGKGFEKEEELRKVKEDNASLIAELESLRKLVELKDTLAGDADEKALKYEGMYNEAVKQKEALVGELEEKKGDIDRLKEVVGGLEKEVEDFKAQNSEWAQGFAKLSEQKGELEQKVEMLKQTVETSDATIQTITDKLRDMQKDRNTLAEELRELKNSNEVYAEDLKTAKAEVKALQEAPPKSPSDVQKMITDLQTQVKSAEALLEKVKQEKVSAEADLAKYQTSESSNMYMGVLGGAASTMVVGGLMQWVFRRGRY